MSRLKTPFSSHNTAQPQECKLHLLCTSQTFLIWFSCKIHSTRPCWRMSFQKDSQQTTALTKTVPFKEKCITKNSQKQPSQYVWVVNKAPQTLCSKMDNCQNPTVRLLLLSTHASQVNKNQASFLQNVTCTEFDHSKIKLEIKYICTTL